MAPVETRRLSLSARNSIVQYDLEGLSSVRIQRLLLKDHGVKTTRQSVRRFLKRFKSTGNIHRQQRAKQHRFHFKVSAKHMEFINMWLSHNPETTADEIRKRLVSYFGLSVTKEYICKIRRDLGWTGKHVKYCQLITHKNKELRLKWCIDALKSREQFMDVIFVDETSIEMSSNGRLSFYQPGSCMDKLPSKAAKPKHSYKVHVWGGISYRGTTSCCIFTGVMDSVIYQKILADNFIPFTKAKFQDGYRLYQDNDSKHKSQSTRQWMEQNNMIDKVMVVPASSPDLNPIENVWSAMKDYLQRKVKPKKKEELVSGIRQYWETLSVQQCGKFIDHIHRVIPQVILNGGGPTVF